jgi:hypothetical protein
VSEPAGKLIAECVDCPFLRVILKRAADSCAHPMMPPGPVVEAYKPPPSECPLRTAPVLLRVSP